MVDDVASDLLLVFKSLKEVVWIQDSEVRLVTHPRFRQWQRVHMRHYLALSKHRGSWHHQKSFLNSLMKDQCAPKMRMSSH